MDQTIMANVAAKEFETVKINRHANSMGKVDILSKDVIIALVYPFKDTSSQHSSGNTSACPGSSNTASFGRMQASSLNFMIIIAGSLTLGPPTMSQMISTTLPSVLNILAVVKSTWVMVLVFNF